MQSAAGGEGGDQKAVQLATAASSVLNAKAGKTEGDDAGGEEERASVGITWLLTKVTSGFCFSRLKIFFTTIRRDNY